MSTSGGPLPSAPAGWYKDPEMAQTLRYWDGHTWTDHRSPDHTASTAAAQVSSATEPPAKVTNTWAWIVALSPLAIILLALAFPSTAQPATLGTGILAITAAIVDANIVSRSVKMGSGAGLMAFLLPPLYLVLRTVRAKSTPWIPITWVVSLLVVIAVINTASS